MSRGLSDLDVSQKLLITLALAAIMAGMVCADLYVRQKLGALSGAPFSFNAIERTFRGDRSTTALKKAVLGPMKRYFSAVENPEGLDAAEKDDLQRIVAWSDAGAPEEQYNGPLSSGGAKPIRAILEQHGCLQCHAPGATLLGNNKDAPLNTFVAVKRHTRPDEGLDDTRLLSLSHIHLLSLGMLSLLLGGLLSFCAYPRWLRTVLIVALPASVMSTVAGWWCVKWFGGTWPALLVALSGASAAGSMAISAVLCAVELWSRRTRPQ